MSDEEFVRRLKTIIEKLGLSREQVCRSVHISKPALARWREGRELPTPLARLPVIEALEAL